MPSFPDGRPPTATAATAPRTPTPPPPAAAPPARRHGSAAGHSERRPAGASGVDLDALEPLLSLDVALLLLAGTALGAVLAAVVVPAVVPDLAASLLGDQPKAYWYLSRSSGVVAYLTLWLSAVLGLALTNRTARLFGGGPAVADVHQFASLLALALAIFHVLILLGDGYAAYSVWQLLVPFAATQHEPFWVGLGQLGFYLAVPVIFSFYVRRRIGVRSWRLIHYGSFVLYLLVLAHGLGAGTDARSSLPLAIYLTTGCTVVFLTNYRLVTAAGRRIRQRGVPAAEPAETRHLY